MSKVSQRKINQVGRAGKQYSQILCDFLPDLVDLKATERFLPFRLPELCRYENCNDSVQIMPGTVKL